MCNYLSAASPFKGNELSGSGVGASVSAEQYAKDLIVLKGIIDELYKNHDSKPSLIAPGGFFDQDWFTKLLQVSGSGVIDFMTHHIYNLGPGTKNSRYLYLYFTKESSISDCYNLFFQGLTRISLARYWTLIT